jgi:hypothetical protein
MKNTKDNIINAVIVGAIMFGCSCTLCNKKYNALSGSQKNEVAAARASKAPIESGRLTKKEVNNVK